MDALEKAIEKAGSVSAFARAIRVAVTTPWMWKQRGNVPAEYCPRIERAFGTPCEELRPDVDWAVLRGKKRAAKQPVSAP
jgi:DNA-binding transcriptional regulator YdaS (Cro superfamily)